MAFSSSPNFTGILDGTDVNELNKKIDYKKTHLNERKELIEEILNGTTFYEDYFDNYFKASINSGDPLSAEVNVCKSLEKMANYLLNSKEIKQEEDREKTKYIFHTDERYFRKKVDRERSIEQMMEIDSPDHKEMVIHFLKTSDPNYKKDKTQTTDLNNVRVSKVNSQETIDHVTSIVNDYQQLLDFVTEKLINKDKDVNRYILTKIKGEVKDDIMLTKDFLLGIWGYNLKNVSESNAPDMNHFDFTNIDHVKGKDFIFINKKGKETKVHVKGLMYFQPGLDPSKELSYTLFDFNETVKQANLTNREAAVLQLLREGYKNIEIENILDLSQKTVRYDIDKIAKKIISVGNKYDLEEVAK